MAKRLGRPYQNFMDRIPGIDDGVKVLALIDTAVRSHDDNGMWTRVPPE